MKRTHSRGAIALTAVAVLIPCGAWYWLGTRQLEREADQLEQVARREASSAAERMAAHLAIRLEELNDHESNRPYIHYWTEYLAHGDTCAALKPRRSPLAKGKRNKMILAHFQVDDHGHLTSPEPWADVQSAVFSDPVPAVPTAHLPGGEQIHASMMPAALISSPERPREEEASAQVMAFHWQTGAFKGQPALMAIRRVVTSGETFAQGFVVDSEAMLHWLFESGLPARIAPGEPRGDNEARVPILGAAWHIEVDDSPAVERALTRASLLRRQFLQSYAGGVLGTLLAGICLVLMIRRSERLAEERSRFAAAAAHELRTPLAGIRLHGEMLALALGNPKKLSEYAGRITDEAERLTRLVSNVFNYAQVDQRRLRIRKEPADLGTVVRDALALVMPILERSGCSLQVRVDDKLPPVAVDKDAVHQMVRNLVDNAEKYTRQAADRRIEVAVYEVPGSLRISVRDHGSGVPHRQRGRIFHAFARHEKGLETSGLGLGLSVVKTLAVAHGGSVEYLDAPGGGALFVISLPADAAASTA